MNSRSEALADASKQAPHPSPHLRRHFPSESGRHAFLVTDAESAWLYITSPAGIRLRSNWRNPSPPVSRSPV